MAQTSPCPRCGTPGSGNFCPNCGASRGQASCPTCGHTPEPGSRFCTQCGTPLGVGAAAPPPAAAAASPASPAAGAGQGSNLGWWVAGLALVALILFVAYPVLTDANEGPAPAAGAAGAPAAGASSVDLGSMTPIQAADRLYDRVMRAASAGDSTEVVMFLPMSIAAYERARPLNADGFYHLSLLQRMAGDAQAALATAGEALEASPDHLLNLGAAAEAAEALGDSAQARDYWQRFVDAYDGEMEAGREEYQMHGTMMGELLQRARDATQG